MRTDDPLDLSEYYAKRGRVLQELGALRDFARLRNRREWQWRRLWLDSGYCSRIKHLTGITALIKAWRKKITPCDLKAYLRDRRYAWQR